MTTITPTTTPADWLVETVEPIHGQTRIGETTGIQIGLSVIVGEGEGDFLDAVAASTYTPPPLPDEGELEKGAVYTWGEHIVMVRQSHTRTIFPPDQTPALFLFWQPEGDGVPDWIEWEWVEVGRQRRYDGVIYRVIQAHQTQPDYTPPATWALWEEESKSRAIPGSRARIRWMPLSRTMTSPGNHAVTTIAGSRARVTAVGCKLHRCRVIGTTWVARATRWIGKSITMGSYGAIRPRAITGSRVCLGGCWYDRHLARSSERLRVCSCFVWLRGAGGAVSGILKLRFIR
jgi:hypothetical protein